MPGYIMGFWRKVRGRCQHCRRPVDRVYELRDGPVIGHFCSRICYERAVEEAKEMKTNPNYTPKEKPDVAYY